MGIGPKNIEVEMETENEQFVENLRRRIRGAKDESELEGIVEEIIEFVKANPEDPELVIPLTAGLIDTGIAREELQVIELGIKVAKCELEDHLDHYCGVRVLLEYNMANGYMAMHGLQRAHDNIELANESLHEAKRLFQALIFRKQHIDPELLHLILTNYGALLSKLDRNIEAIDFYMDALKVNPYQAIAMAKSGQVLASFALTINSHDLYNLYEGWQLLSKACQLKEEVISISGQATLLSFESNLSMLAGGIDDLVPGGLDTLRDWDCERDLECEASDWLQQINDDRLFLTLNQVARNSMIECVDDLLPPYFILVGESKEELSRAQLFLATLNQIKEEYVVARYLFYCRNPDDAEDIAWRTFFAAAEPSTELLGLIPGLHKASFRLATDCLDKIALCLNVYFQLGFESSKINFNKIWFEGLDHRRGLSRKLHQVMNSNSFLRGLRDMQNDWFLQMFPPGDLRGIRNSLTHSRFVLHHLQNEDNSASEAPESSTTNWTIEEFHDATLFLLRLIKAAILYLVCSVIWEEQGKQEHLEENSLAYEILHVKSRFTEERVEGKM
jgi:tetratricopeptide (TPR) repeat protein